MAWPLPKDAVPGIPRGGRIFGAERADGERRHAGVDLFAERGDPVETPAAGEVVSVFAWPSRDQPTGRAVMIQSDDGPVFLLAPLEPSTLRVGVGDPVELGDQVGDVGVYPRGSSMLHFEMYREGTEANRQWWVGRPRPAALLDPVPFLKREGIAHAIASRSRPAEPPVLPPSIPTPPAIAPMPGPVPAIPELVYAVPAPVVPRPSMAPAVAPAVAPQLVAPSSAPAGWGAVALVVGLALLGEELLRG